MATTSNTTSGQTTAPTSGQKAAATRKRNATRKSATATKSNVRRTAASTKTTARSATSATSAESRVRVTQAQQIAERVVLVPVGASLLARDNVVSTVKGLATKYRTRADVERELRRYERRGVTARNRFERQVRRTRTKFERQLRQRRNIVERSRALEPAPARARGALGPQGSREAVRDADVAVREAGFGCVRPDIRLLAEASPTRAEESAGWERFAGLITSPANEAPSPPSTAGASRKWRPVGL